MIKLTGGCGTTEARGSMTVLHPLSVNETQNNTKGFSIYPNPTRSTLTVELHEPATVEIYSVQGKLLFKNDAANLHTIDLSKLDNGVYFGKVMNATKTFVKLQH